MNLHIVPDNTFSNRFYANLREAGVLDNNKVVVRTNEAVLQHMKHEVPFARLYSEAFSAAVGDTAAYEKVFIHQFTPLLYRWVVKNHFQSLNWMVWGADLYNLPFLKADLYEPLTKRFRTRFDPDALLYLAKVALLHLRFRKEAYRRIDQIFTWMHGEYAFAHEHLPSLSAEHQFFFYENDVPYQALDKAVGKAESGRRPVYVVGNSATPELNHLDAIRWMEDTGVEADLIVPVSYGNRRYAAYLEEQQATYRHGRIRFLREYMDFTDYLRILASADGLVMNNVRPQGYGNIFMMMYLGKRIFLNPRNLSIPDLDRAGLMWKPLHSMMEASDSDEWRRNRSAVLSLLSHESLIALYKELFGRR